MGEIGQVVKLDLDFATIKLKRTEACSKCRACNNGFSSSEMLLNVKNTCNANIGDFVNIELEVKYFFKALLIMYVLPLFMLLIGFFIASFFSSYFANNKFNELFSFLSGIFLMLLTYLIIKLNHSKFDYEKYIPTATNIIE